MDNLVELLVADSKKRFVKDYVDRADRDKIAAETLGLAISRYAEWDGEKVALFLVTALYSGLEDANWHTEAKVFYNWMMDMENGAMIGKVLKEEIDAING